MEQIAHPSLFSMWIVSTGIKLLTSALLPMLSCFLLNTPSGWLSLNDFSRLFYVGQLMRGYSQNCWLWESSWQDGVDRCPSFKHVMEALSFPSNEITAQVQRHCKGQICTSCTECGTNTLVLRQEKRSFLNIHAGPFVHNTIQLLLANICYSPQTLNHEAGGTQKDRKATSSQYWGFIMVLTSLRMPFILE